MVDGTAAVKMAAGLDLVVRSMSIQLCLATAVLVQGVDVTNATDMSTECPQGNADHHVLSPRSMQTRSVKAGMILCVTAA